MLCIRKSIITFFVYNWCSCTILMLQPWTSIWTLLYIYTLCNRWIITIEFKTPFKIPALTISPTINHWSGTTCGCGCRCFLFPSSPCRFLTIQPVSIHAARHPQIFHTGLSFLTVSALLLLIVCQVILMIFHHVQVEYPILMTHLSYRNTETHLDKHAILKRSKVLKHGTDCHVWAHP